MKKRRALLIDFNNIFYRSVKVHESLFFDGFKTGGVYGFVSQLASAVNLYHPMIVVACMDSRPYHRKLLWEGYKERRKTGPSHDAKNIAEQKDICIDIINYLGIDIVKQDGFEADDLMAGIAMQSHFNRKVILMSNDTDLYQLLYLDDIEIYKKAGENYTLGDFNKEYPGFKLPDDWILYTAITGGHNDLPKFNGIGPVTAKKHIRGDQYLNLPEDLLENSKRLATLPLPGFEMKNFSDWLGSNRGVNFRSAEMLLHRYGINPTLSIRSAFEYLCK